MSPAPIVVAPRVIATPSPAPEEGWTWLSNATKWHYFRDGRSLCRRWGTWGSPTLEQGNDRSPDNCKPCARAILKEKGEEL